MGLANCNFPLTQPKPEPPNSNIIYSCCFNTDASLLFVAISEILVVYNADTGEVVTKPTRAGISALIQLRNPSTASPSPRTEKPLPQPGTYLWIQQWPHLHSLEIQPRLWEKDRAGPQTHSERRHPYPRVQPPDLRTVQWRSRRFCSLHPRQERNSQGKVQRKDHLSRMVCWWTDFGFRDNQRNPILQTKEPRWKERT